MENSYDFSNKKRGLAYIIVNKNFEERTDITLKYTERNGAEKDYENMKKVFKLLGFKLFPFKDQTAKGIEDILTKASQRKDLHQRQSFACVISSHGGERSVGDLGGTTAKNEHYIVGSDSQTVETRTLIDMFSSSNCPGLKNTPKLFFIQACRDNKDEEKRYDDGVKVVVSSTLKPNEIENMDKYIDTTDEESDEDDECRGKSKLTTNTSVCTGKVLSRSSDRETVDKKSELESLDETDPDKRENHDRVDTDISSPALEEVLECPCHEDMIVMFAGPSGKYAWRNPGKGSWLLLQLFSVVQEHTRNGDIGETGILSLLTEVSGQVSSMTSNTQKPETNEKKMVPVINHKLLNHIYFFGMNWDLYKSKLKDKKTPDIW